MRRADRGGRSAVRHGAGGRGGVAADAFHDDMHAHTHTLICRHACTRAYTQTHKPPTVKLLEAAVTRCSSTLMQVPVGDTDGNQYARLVAFLPFSLGMFLKLIPTRRIRAISG